MLSGYPHIEEVIRFAELDVLAARNAAGGRQPSGVTIPASGFDPDRVGSDARSNHARGVSRRSALSSQPYGLLQTCFQHMRKVP